MFILCLRTEKISQIESSRAAFAGQLSRLLLSFRHHRSSSEIIVWSVSGQVRSLQPGLDEVPLDASLTVLGQL